MISSVPEKMQKIWQLRVRFARLYATIEEKRAECPMGGSMWELLLAAGIPSVLVSGRDLDRRRLELLQIRGTLAAMSLGEATATALKNGHANGETDKALAYEQRVKHEMREFLEKSGVEHVA